MKEHVRVADLKYGHDEISSTYLHGPQAGQRLGTLHFELMNGIKRVSDLDPLIKMGGKLMQSSAFRDKAGKLSISQMRLPTEPLELRGHEMRPLASQTIGKFFCAFDCGICFVDEHHGTILHSHPWVMPRASGRSCNSLFTSVFVRP